MGLQLPPALAALLVDLGFQWTRSDEVILAQVGDLWRDFESGLDDVEHLLAGALHRMRDGNAGEGVEAFTAAMLAGDAPQATVRDAGTGSLAVGAGCYISAAIVLAVKSHVIVQLALLAAGLSALFAAAGPTMGASLAQVPVVKQVTGRLIDMIISRLTALLV
ncbi:hypothetical protein ACFYSC_22195 [Streptosporangium sp. NPDC004379]|uniref:WXG100-like domain-containing protein n=1 Tax=Streptosporangium sp. NPDC004379 TaxID=3366189 RepID=UPI0036C2DED4